jgi:signal transduction histidine kinase
VYIPYFIDKGYFGGLILSYDNRKLTLEKNKVYTTSIILVLLYMAIASVVVFIFISRILTQPVQELTRLMTKLKEGELNQWFQIKNMDEIGEMGKSVNDLVLTLQETFSNIKKTMAVTETNNKNKLVLNNSKVSIKEFMEGLGKAEYELRLLYRKLIDTIEDERKKLAVDLHDDIGQSLTVLQMDINLIEKSISEDDPQQKKMCQEAMQKTRDLARKIRATCSRLRPEILEDMGLVPTIQTQLDELKNRNKIITSDFSTNFTDKRLKPQIELTLYRVVQEAINNILKHSKAKYVSISLFSKDDKILLNIDDDGVGFDQNERGLPQGSKTIGIGLPSIIERVSGLNGTIDIISSKGNGTRILIELPA